MALHEGSKFVQGSGEVHEPRHLYAFTHRRRAPRSMSSLLIAKRFPSASASRRRSLWVPPSAMQSSLAVGAWLRQPTHPSGHRARSTHAREASAMKALTTDRGWAALALALALRGGLHSPDELLHSGERLRRVLWSDNFPDRCRNFPVTRLKIPCLASTGNFVLNPLNFLVDWTEESPFQKPVSQEFPVNFPVNPAFVPD
jgi:hypothetical protein